MARALAWLPPRSRVAATTVPMQERLQVRQALRALLAQLPADTLAARCVRPVQRYIDTCVAAGLGATRVQVGARRARRGWVDDLGNGWHPDACIRLLLVLVPYCSPH